MSGAAVTPPNDLLWTAVFRQASGPFPAGTATQDGDRRPTAPLRGQRREEIRQSRFERMKVGPGLGKTICRRNCQKETRKRRTARPETARRILTL